MNATQQQISAALLLTFSILSLTTTVTLADQQTQIKLETITITASGTATPIGSGPSGTATLTLNGIAYTNSNHWLMVQNVSGSLQIGSTSYTIIDGHGSVSAADAAAIFAETNDGKGQLILQGTMTGNTATFDMPSQLASTSYLSLSGTITTSPTQQTTNLAVSSTNTVGSATTSAAIHTNATRTSNATSPVSSTIRNTTTTANTSAVINPTMQISNTAASSTSVYPSSTTSYNSSSTSSALTPTQSSSAGPGQHNLVISIAQGQGEICVTSQQFMPVCTTASQTVVVNNGDMVNFDSDAVSGFAWDHYDGLGIGQAQNFNANITQDTTIGAYFIPTQAQAANFTSIDPSNDSVTTISTTVTNLTTFPVATSNDVTTTVVNAPATSATIPMLSNYTISTAQSTGQTFYVTQTAANTTVTNTVTTTVANVTVTQANSTTTVTTTTTVVTTGP